MRRSAGRPSQREPRHPAPPVGFEDQSRPPTPEEVPSQLYLKLQEENERYKRALGESRSLLRGAEDQIAEWRTVIQDLTYSLETERLEKSSLQQRVVELEQRISEMEDLQAPRPPFKPYVHKKRRNNPVPLDFMQLYVLNSIVNDLNNLYEEISNRDPNAPKVSKALYVRFGRQFLGEDTPAEFLIGSQPELDSNRINIVRRVFRRAQRIARSKNRRSVIDSDVLLAMPPQT
ncbi:hypothetical protein AVEN_49189-1 [Araneus ventricosus]|uniref:Uncharacterized protein n=1 Tax=Araneus ventricosus TaxID=182803 RepID=A0A4Y2R310_ARAVE|nr:hypothetical protein AVEN_49189-1 [Araneus ventricosus]